MKSEERHELQQNDLENFLYYRLPHYLREYGSYVLLAVALVVLGYVLWSRYTQKKQSELQNAWAALDGAVRSVDKNPIGQLNGVREDFKFPQVQAQALIQQAAFYNFTVLAGNPPEGIQDVKVTRQEALEQAERCYRQVLRDYPNQYAQVAAAEFGLATIAENRGEWETAQQIYQRVADARGPYGGTLYAEYAQRRLKMLTELKAPVNFGGGARLPDRSLSDVFGPIGPATMPTGPAALPATTGRAVPASAPAASQPKK